MSDTKDFLLRALREVAPEMELLRESHQQYMKNFVIKLSTYKVVHFATLQKNFISKNMSENSFRHIFLWKTSPKHYFRKHPKVTPILLLPYVLGYSSCLIMGPIFEFAYPIDWVETKVVEYTFFRVLIMWIFFPKPFDNFKIYHKKSL